MKNEPGMTAVEVTDCYGTVTDAYHTTCPLWVYVEISDPFHWDRKIAPAVDSDIMF